MAAVVRDYERLSPVFDAETGVLGGLDALDHQRHSGNGAQPLQVSPVQAMLEAFREVALIGKVGELDTIEVLEDALLVQDVGVTEFPLAGVGAQVVHREHHGGVASVFGAAHQNLSEFTILEEVKLEPQGVVGDLGHLLDAVAGSSAEAHDGVGGSGGAGRGQLTGRVGALVGAGGGQHHRHTDALPQYLGG